jgi:hypothetical protein
LKLAIIIFPQWKRPDGQDHRGVSQGLYSAMLRKNIFDNVCFFDARELGIQTLKFHTESLMIDSEQM